MIASARRSATAPKRKTAIESGPVVIRVFNVYFPARTLFLGVSEWIVVFLAFTLALIARAGRDADLVLADEHGIYKIALVAVVYLLCMYYLDLYETKVLTNRHEVLTRILQVL